MCLSPSSCLLRPLRRLLSHVLINWGTERQRGLCIKISITAYCPPRPGSPKAYDPPKGLAE